MGKGTGEMEGILQLAGGLLVGGIALYRLAKDDDESSAAQKKLDTASGDKVDYGSAALEKKKQQEQKQQQQQQQPKKSSGSSNAETPGWMSQKEARSNQNEVKAISQSWRSIEEVSSPQQEEKKHDEYVPEWASNVEPTMGKKKALAFRESWKSESQNVFVDEEQEQDEEEQKYASSSNVSEASASTTTTTTEEKKSSQRAEHDEYVPSWMSQKEPQTAVHETISTSQLKSTKAATKALTTANQTVSEISTKLSDTVFVFPGSNKNYFGKNVTQNKQQTTQNYNNSIVQVMETSAGAAGIVSGALNSGSSASILATSSSIQEMIPTMFELAHKKLPAVFHVSTFSLDENLAIQQDCSEIMAARDSGFALLAAGNAQEAHDFAVISHIVAQRVKQPVLHFFDGFRGDQSGRITAASSQVLENIKTKHGLTQVPPGTPVENVFSHTMQQLSVAFGRDYNIFQYQGPKSPDAVIVALGSIADVLGETLQANRTVGVLKVRLLKPWSAQHFLQALPTSAKRVCVLDQSSTNALFQEVAATFHLAKSKRTVVPLLIGGRVMPSVSGFSPALVQSIISNLFSSNPQTNFCLGQDAASSLTVDYSKGDITLRDASGPVKQIAIFATKQLERVLSQATRAVAEQLVGRAGVNAQQLTSVDPYAGDQGVVRSELRISPHDVTLPESYAIQNANVVVVQENLLHAVGLEAVQALGNNGSLMVLPSGAADSEQSSSLSGIELPSEVRAQLARKSADVVKVDLQSMFQHAIENGIVDAEDHDVICKTAVWVSLVAGIQVAKGPALFDKLLPHLQGAFRAARPFEGEGEAQASTEVMNLVSTRLARVEGYMTRLGKESNMIAFNSPAAITPFKDASSSSSSSSDFNDSQSYHSGALAAMSPIGPPPSSHIHTSTAHFAPRLQVSRPKTHNSTSIAGKSGSEIVKLDKHKAALTRIFPEAYETETVLRPSEHAKVYQVRLTKNQRLTPLDYDRNVFHLEFDISGTDLTYQIGDALGVYGHNHEGDVDHFIAEYGLDPDALVSIPARGKMEEGKTELVSVRNALVKYIDILGKPSKKFYAAMSSHATRRYEHLKLAHIATDDPELFKIMSNEGTTFAEVILQYKSAKLTIEQIVEIVPPIKARHYSIASSMKLHPRSVHLLVVAVEWDTPLGKRRYGQCTRYLANLDPTKGEDIYVSVDIMTSLMRLPSPEVPIVMAGLGTGLAVYKAFIEERKYQKEMGMDVGPCVLYFGSRYRSKEYMYGELLDKWAEEGLISNLRLAFSRDQPHKVYIQNLMNEDKALLKDLLGPEKKGYFYLCGPTWPVPHVNRAVAEALSADGTADEMQLEMLKAQGRLLYEVY